MTGLGKNEMKPKAGMPWSVRFSEGLDPTATSGRLEQELDLDGLVRKLDLARLGAAQYAS